MKNKNIIYTLFLVFFTGIIGVLVRVWIKDKEKEIRRWKDSSDKYYHYTNVLSYWLKKKQMGGSVEDYLQKHNLGQVAIYGMGFIGERLLDELKNSSIEVVYAIDQDADEVWADVDVYTLEEKLPKVDAIIVTPLHYYDLIEKSLKEKTDSLIISLEDVLCRI